MKTKTKRKLTDRQITNIVCDALYDFGKTCGKKIGADNQDYVEYLTFCLLGSFIAEKQPKATLKAYFKEILVKNYKK